jgi:hypothetical protein
MANEIGGLVERTVVAVTECESGFGEARYRKPHDVSHGHEVLRSGI